MDTGEQGYISVDSAHTSQTIVTTGVPRSVYRIYIEKGAVELGVHVIYAGRSQDVDTKGQPLRVKCVGSEEAKGRYWKIS